MVSYHKDHITKPASGCRCDGCERIRAKRRDSYYRNRQYTREPAFQARLDRAEEWLKDGATYAEAARTAGVQIKNLRKLRPGYEDNIVEWRRLMGWVKNDRHRERLNLFREIWHMKEEPA